MNIVFHFCAMGIAEDGERGWVDGIYKIDRTEKISLDTIREYAKVEANKLGYKWTRTPVLVSCTRLD